MLSISQKIRIGLRWSHLVFGVVIMCYVYSPWHEVIVFQWVVKAVIIPYLGLSGLWLWKFAAINKLLRIG